MRREKRGKAESDERNRRRGEMELEDQRERVKQAIKAENEANGRYTAMCKLISDMQSRQSDEEENSRICSDESKSSSRDDVRTIRQRKVDRSSLERQWSDGEREDLQECDRFEEIRNLKMHRCLRVCEALKQKLRRQQAGGARQSWIL